MQQPLVLFLLRRAQHQNATALRRRKSPVVEKILIEGDERATHLRGEAEVLDVARTAQRRFLYHEEDVPPQPFPHEPHQTRRKIRVRIHARRFGQSFGERPKLGSQCPQGYFLPTGSLLGFLAAVA